MMNLNVNTGSVYAQMYGNADRFQMPECLADTAEKFHKLFYEIPKNDWDKCKGNAYIHILAYELDELILNTIGMESMEIDDAKVELAEVIKYECQCGIDRAYKILHKLYIPTESEYLYLCKREYGKDSVLNPVLVKGVYESVEEIGWFNFALDKWNKWHDALAENDPKESDIKKYAKSIKDEWDSFTDEERFAWEDRVVE